MNALQVLPNPNNDGVTDFKTYLENSLRNPFTLNLEGRSLLEVVNTCAMVKSKTHPGYKENLAGLVYNLQILEGMYHTTLQPIQVTDIFWNYFTLFCKQRGLKASTIHTLCCQLRSILSWAIKHNAAVSPSYADIDIRRPRSQEIALTADEVSRITYFDIDRFYADRRSDYRKTMHRVRDMFVLSCNLFQRHSDMVRIDAGCFNRNIFRILQQKTGNLAVVDIDRFSIEPKTTYRILEKYGYKAPYTATIGNYNYYLHQLMRDIGLDSPVHIEERNADGLIVSVNVPKWKLISSHTARRTAITVNVLRGQNLYDIKKCSGHTDLTSLDNYVCENE